MGVDVIGFGLSFGGSEAIPTYPLPRPTFVVMGGADAGNEFDA
jgi:hypothetical protein